MDERATAAGGTGHEMTGSPDPDPTNSGPSHSGSSDSGSTSSEPTGSGPADSGPGDAGPGDAGRSDAGRSNAGSAGSGLAGSGRTTSGPVASSAEPPRTRLWRDGRVDRESFPIDQIGEILREPDTFVWADLRYSHDEDLKVITEELGLAPLAIEDALSPRERSKLDRYENHLFLNIYTVCPDGEELSLGEVSAFVTERALITVRDHEGFDMDEVVRRWDTGADLASFGVSFLLHGLLDVIVDQHFATIQALDDEAEELEDLLFEETHPDRQLQRRSFRLRKNLSIARRVVLPMREVVNTLMRRDLHVIPDGMSPYFEDVYDHVLRATEWTDNLRDLVANIMETRIALQGNHLNEVMKKVTSWAAIIAVPTAVTGYYGQNLPYPGSEQHWGYLASTVLIIVLSVGLYAVFKKRDWL